jgi:tetratricopeptide (TPR) repeat protein
MKVLVRFLLTLIFAIPTHALAQDENIIERYEAHVAKEEWSKALPVIEEIVKRAPKIATSWHNYGVVLDQLSRHSEAADAFKRSYALEPDDFGHQYRAFRSLALSGDRSSFVAFAKIEVGKDPEILGLLLEGDEFSPMTNSAEFKALVSAQR